MLRRGKNIARVDLALRKEDGDENTLGTTNYPFCLFFMKNYFINIRPRRRACRFVDRKFPDIKL